MIIRGVDLAGQLTLATCLALRDQYGVEFVGRYYRRGVFGKWTINPPEYDAIKRSGLQLVAVMQFKNDHPGYFTRENGRADAAAAIAKAEQMNHPFDKPIYNAVDTDAIPSNIGRIVEYFAEFTPMLHDAGYLVGVYGDDLVLRTMYDAQLAEFGWLANAKAWRDDKGFDDCDILQHTPRRLAGVEVDPLESTDFETAGAFLLP